MTRKSPAAPADGATAPTSGRVAVTFRLPLAVTAERVELVGEFSDWDPLPMSTDDDSHWTTLQLDPGEYQYRFLLDGSHWENAWDADSYVANDYGSTNSVVTVQPPTP